MRRNNNKKMISDDDKALPAWRRDVKTNKALFAEIFGLIDNPFRNIPDARREELVSVDISYGRETFPIRAINGVDDDPAPTTCTYVTDAMYSSSCPRPSIEPIGCGCVNGCSDDSDQCPCIVKNFGCQIPFNEDGQLLKYLEDGVHQCGLACKCPPTCMNRVGQSGPLNRLEIFKTEKKGWGVRSRDAIPSGGFICEYVGEILTDSEADKRVDEDGYLYDIVGGYAIDGAKHGNVGRFVNHSCTPNAFAQNVFYNNGSDEERFMMPRIMFFAGKEIGPLEEIFYDYNYKKGSVVANGAVKEKACHCGSRGCRKRLY